MKTKCLKFLALVCLAMATLTAFTLPQPTKSEVQTEGYLVGKTFALRAEDVSEKHPMTRMTFGEKDFNASIEATMNQGGQSITLFIEVKGTYVYEHNLITYNLTEGTVDMPGVGKRPLPVEQINSLMPKTRVDEQANTLISLNDKDEVEEDAPLLYLVD